MRRATDLRELARRRAALIATAAETMAGKFDRPVVSGLSHNDETRETKPAASAGGKGGGVGGTNAADTPHGATSEHQDIVVLGVPVRVGIVLDNGRIVRAAMVTPDEGRKRLTEAIDRQLRAGRSIEQQAIRQAAMADLLRELRGVELAMAGNPVRSSGKGS